MFRYLLSGGFGSGFRDYLMGMLLSLPIILLSLTIHEVCHGLAAKKCGDPTAANLGRLTLNPLKHLDPIGFLCMLLFGFGWAKPVPINSRYFKKPRRDMALTAAAGPAANLGLGILFGLLFETVLTLVLRFGLTESNFFLLLLQFLQLGLILNVYLAVFNLLPIPPFDGSRIFFVFLPVKWYYKIMKYERYIMIGVLILLYFGFLTGPLQTLAYAIVNGILRLIRLIPFFV